MNENSLFQMLLNLFESGLNQNSNEAGINFPEDEPNSQELAVLREASNKATRVVSSDEIAKMSEASYKYLMNYRQIGLLNSDDFEQIMTRIEFSESKIVGLDELKWIIRDYLDQNLNQQQLAYLDLILYPETEEYKLQ